MTTNLSNLPQAPNVPQQTIPQMSNMNEPQSQNVIISDSSATSYSTADLDQRRPQEVDMSDQGGGHKSMEEMMKQVQVASGQGLTNISQVPTHHASTSQQHTIDTQAMANNLEKSEELEKKRVRFTEDDYIKNYQVPNTTEATGDTRATAETLFEQFKIPIIVGLLYYIFEMPAIQKLLLKAFPKMFKSDANINDYGALLMAIIFGTLYYGITKLYEMF
jgi:hypothetical protein